MPYTGPERRKYIRTPKPPCPTCGSDKSAVIDSDVNHLPHIAGAYTRQRECEQGHRWYTVERNMPTTTCGGDNPPNNVHPVK